MTLAHTDDLDYYVTAVIWLRVLGLKAKNKDAMTATERNVVQLIETMSLNLPEPLCLYLLTFRNITTAIGTHLYPQFPPMPEAFTDWPEHPGLEVPGFYDNQPVNAETHNLYEEVPCLGMALASLVQALQAGVGL
jgi:hypothetical protein